MILQIASELRRCAIARAIALGLSAVEKAKSEIDASPAPDSSFIRILCEIAIWLDFVLGLRGWVEDTLKRWPAAARAELSHREGLFLRFVESTVWLHKEEYDRAIYGFCEIIAAKDVLNDAFLYVLANYYAARCRYYQLRYDEASQFLQVARSQVSNLDHEAAHATVLDILESRILIKRKPLKEVAGEASSLLSGALQALAADDHLTRGKVMIFQAQIAADALHQGKHAAELLDAAVAEIAKHPHPGQPAAGRAYLSRGYEKLRQADELQEQLQAALPILWRERLFTAMLELWPRLRKALAPAAAAGLIESLGKIVVQMQTFLDTTVVDYRRPAPGAEDEIRRLQDEALADADRAVSIFEQLGHRRNLANSRLLIASCMLARRDYDFATKAIRKALDSAAGNDAAVESRAWSLAAEIECARFEDKREPDPGARAAAARGCADKALRCAEKADPRTLAIAHGVAGLALLLGDNPQLEDCEQAGFHRDFVRTTLRKFSEPSLRRRLEVLQAKLLSEGDVAATLTKFAQTGGGARFAELETAITKIAWIQTGTIADFERKLVINRRRADGLLKRAGINPRRPRKMAIRPEGKKLVAAQQRKLENAS